MTTYWSFLNDLEPALVSMAWRGGAWMLLVALVLGCSTKASAATRHWIAVCGMAGLLLVTALGMADMRWIISTPASAVLREPVVVASPASMAGSHAGEAAPVVHLQSATVPAEASSAALSFTVTEAKEISSPRPSEPIPWLALTWSAGVAFFGLRLLRTALLLHRLRCASVAASEAVVAEVEKLRQQLGVRVPVTLLTADGPVMPMAWGVFRPTILLPPDAREWPHSRTRAVLLHELSHLRRRDILTGTIALLAAAMHWFNPLSWFIYQRLHRDRELACDDAVLAEDVLASDYATHLLAIGSGNPATTVNALASTMARPEAVEGRINSILDPNVSRNRLGTIMGSAVTLVAIVVAVAMGGMQLLTAAPEAIGPKGIDINGPMTFQTAEHACVAAIADDGASGHLHLVDLKDNGIAWSIDTAQPPHDRPLLSGTHVLLMTADRTLHCHSIVDGALLWSHETEEESEYFLDAVQRTESGGTNVILANLSGAMINLDAETGHTSVPSSNAANPPDHLAISHFSSSSNSVLPGGGEEVPPQFRDAYADVRPTEFINDPQHLLAKEVRERLTESLRSASVIENRNVQVLILDRSQNFPEVTVGQPGDFKLWSDDGSRWTIAYFLGAQSRLLSWPMTVRSPPAGNGPPSFQLTKFIRLMNTPAATSGGFGQSLDNAKLEGDPEFEETDDWNVLALGGRHVFPVAEFEPGVRDGEGEAPIIQYAQAWTVTKVTSGTTVSGLGGEVQTYGEGRLYASELSVNGEAITLPPVPVFTTNWNRVEEILVEKGDRVGPGKPLLRFSGRAAALQIRQASADLDSAESALDSLEQNSDDRERMRRKVARSRVELEKAAAELMKQTLRSPAHGIVVEIDAEVGKPPSSLHRPIVVIQPE